jgi:transposase InsO family protein
MSGVRPQKRWKATIRIPGIIPATDLVERRFRPDGQNVFWVADITYLRAGEGWRYLAAAQDAYSRQIVGWSMTIHMRATLVLDALHGAPAPGAGANPPLRPRQLIRVARVRARRPRRRDRGLDGLPRRRV